MAQLWIVRHQDSFEIMRVGLVIAVMLTALVFVEGCATFASHSNPLAGWERDYTSRPGDTVIEKDCQDYIQTLPAKQRNGAMVTEFYKDGNGQHAVQIEVRVEGLLSGIRWEHVLIYDKGDKRIKVKKYFGGRYMNM